MKTKCEKSLICLCFLLFFAAINTQAIPKYTGFWQGSITAEGSSPKVFTLYIKSQEGNILTGVSYTYNSAQSELGHPAAAIQSLDFIGLITAGECKLTELPSGDSLSSDNASEKRIISLKLVKENHCDMLKGTWSLALSGNENTLGSVSLASLFNPETSSFSPLPPAVSERVKRDFYAGVKFNSTLLSKPLILEVSSPNIKIQISDYLEEDNDTVSVFYNRAKIISSHRIKKKSLNTAITLSKQQGLNELIVYAENLGILPPNTCTMIVDDGKTKQHINVYSDKQHSAAIYLSFKSQ